MKKFTLFLITFVMIVTASCIFYSSSSSHPERNKASDTGNKEVINKPKSNFIENLIWSKPKSKNILILVGDKEESNTDTMLLVNFSNEKLNILSIPRDTQIKMSGKPICKVNSIFSNYGTEETVKSIKDMLQVDISYYIYMNISCFREIIDILGGIDYNVPVNMDYDDPVQNLHIHLKKGINHLDGDKAEQFLRFRKPGSGKYSQEMLKYYNGSDLKRCDAQLNFIKEAIKQKATVSNLAKSGDIIKSVYKNVKTNISIDEIIKLSKAINIINSSNVNTFMLPGSENEDSKISFYIIDKRKSMEITEQYFK